MQTFHTIFDLVYSAILSRCTNDLTCFSTAKYYCFGNLDWTAHVDTVESSGEFSKKPAVILLLIAIMITFLEGLRICVFNPLYYFFYATLKFHSLLLLYFLGVLIHSAVEFFHLFVTMHLLIHELFLSCFEFLYIFHMWVQAIGFDNIELFLADFAFAAKLMCLNKKVR